jgi:membrane protease YdiL (CAAX protease family)
VLTSLASIVLRRLPRRSRLAAGLAVAGASVALARRHASWADLGMGRSSAAKGLRWGAGAGAPIVAVIGAASAFPVLRARFADERIAAHSPARATYELVARIPVETALAEELMFRSALLGIGVHRRSTTSALAVSSALFGLWHIVPTWHDMSAPIAGAIPDGPGARAGGVAVVVMATAAAGAAFGLLRLRSGSVIAPPGAVWITERNRQRSGSRSPASRTPSSAP